MTTRPVESEKERVHLALDFIRRLNVRADKKTALELGDWLNQSPDNERVFVWLSTLLRTASLSLHFAENRTRASKTNAPWFRRLPMSLAASLVLAVITLAGIGIHIAQSQLASHHTTTLSEAFTLQDKSYIRLYDDSQIRAAISKEARLVKLAGKGAAFEVETNTVPFQVKMADLLITATGTEFNVIRRNQDDRTDIYLKFGKLDVSGRKVHKLQMAPGDVLKVHDGGAVEKTRADVPRRDNKVVDGWTYAQVADAINRENVVFQIEVRGSVRSKEAGGIVDLADPIAWLNLLRHAGLRVTPDAGLWIVEPGAG